MSSPPSPSLSFPHAQQAQIIRANQRDIYHISLLKEQTEGVLRSWFGTRWLTRWDKEVDLLSKLLYYGLTTGRAFQTLGEEYTDIWQYSSFKQGIPPSQTLRILLVLLPTLPTYIIGRLGNSHRLPARLTANIKHLPIIFEVFTEVNLAVFYIMGTYYDTIKRILGVRHISATPNNPHIRPPSYALLGILLGVRLLYRLKTALTPVEPLTTKGKDRVANVNDDDGQELCIDNRPTSTLLAEKDDDVVKDAEYDDNTILDIASLPQPLRDGRKCTLCLEERTDSTATECGHLFCWNCIVAWGREKPECPLCRQSLSLTRLLPIYNL